jgi:hypothetical protein
MLMANWLRNGITFGKQPLNEIHVNHADNWEMLMLRPVLPWYSSPVMDYRRGKPWVG